MRLPISRSGAAVLLLMVVACPAARAGAGVVTPPPAEVPAVTELSTATPATALPLPTTSSDPQPFWFPGIDDGAVGDVSLSSVPIQAVEADGVNIMLPGSQEHPLIPLPPSAWTGMAGLLGLGALKLMRNFRRLLA